jgi:hypothetical protein
MLHGVVGEEGPASARVTDADAAIDNAEASLCRGGIATHDDDGPRPHVLFLADDVRDPLPPVMAKDLRGLFEPVGRVAGVRR